MVENKNSKGLWQSVCEDLSEHASSWLRPAVRVSCLLDAYFIQRRQQWPAFPKEDFFFCLELFQILVLAQSLSGFFISSFMLTFSKNEQ